MTGGHAGYYAGGRFIRVMPISDDDPLAEGSRSPQSYNETPRLLAVDRVRE